MAALRTILALLSLGARAHPAILPTETTRDLVLNLEPVLSGGFHVILLKDTERTIIGHIGRTLSSPYLVEDIDGGVEVTLGATNLTINTVEDEETSAKAIKFRWQAEASTRLEDCIDFGSKHWYAGPMQESQIYPIENAEQVYSASYNKGADNGAIMERYWLNSAGEYIYVHSEVPLFVDYKNLLANHLCFGAELAEPYSTRRGRVVLAYDFWFLPDVKSAHMHAVENYLGKPSDTPDYRMVQHPIWSTWAQYSREINDAKLMNFALEIMDFGFNNAQIEIDDHWESCYGSLEVNTDKFPNFVQIVKDLKQLGYRVTIWVHPFINQNCEPWYTEAMNNGYFVTNEAGSTNTTWWNNNGTVAGYIDFTNPWAADWWVQRITSLLEAYDIDSIKVDGAEASYAPEIATLTGDIELQPHLLVQEFAKVCARFGNMVEIQSGFRTQDLNVFTRMVDRDSFWDLNNGLASIITTTFQMNLNGYPFVLPDVIGGNGYNLEHDQSELPTKNLFIRWVQANTFLPVMQFSFAPWNFDEETLEISKKYVELHEKYADVIYEAMQAAVNDGTPVNKPIWWIDPTDEEALFIWDEYLLGETVLVAPVLSEDTEYRNIYLPAGIWYEEGDKNRVIEGPIWLPYYPAPLESLPYFVRDMGNSRDSQGSHLSSAILILCSVTISVLRISLK